MNDLSREKFMISALIITKNEEKNIARCLESLKWADEIIILDSQSKDKTVEISKRYTDKIFSVEWHGYAKTKNLGKDIAKGEWILWVDADEEVTPALAEEIKSSLKQAKVISGFYVPRKSQFLGRWIKHCGWYPDYVLRLFKKNEGRFDETKKVHEGVIIRGNVAYFKNVLLHRPYSDLGNYFNKFNRYTSLSANELQDKNRKTRWYHLFIYPIIVFFKKYILKLGILDSREGFILCMFTAFYVFTKYTKLWWKENESSKSNTFLR